MPSKPVKGSLRVTRSLKCNASRTGGGRRKQRKQRVRTHRSLATQRVVDTTDAPGSADSSSSNDAIAGPSDAQTFEFGDPFPSTWDDSFNSPEAALHGVVDANYEMYRSRLMAAPAHRCVKVADNARGDQMVEHVLCIPMTFKAGPGGIADRHVAFVCSCSDMASNVESIVGRQTAKMTYAEFCAHTKPCWHASAAKDLSVEEAGWLAALSDDGFYQRISDMELDRCPIAVIRSNVMDSTSLVLSVCERENGWPRSIVGATTTGALLCRNDRCCSKGHEHKSAHCKTVADTIGLIEAELQEQNIMSASAVATELSAIAAELQGLHLMADGSQRASCQPSVQA